MVHIIDDIYPKIETKIKLQDYNWYIADYTNKVLPSKDNYTNLLNELYLAKAKHRSVITKIETHFNHYQQDPTTLKDLLYNHTDNDWDINNYFKERMYEAFHHAEDDMGNEYSYIVYIPLDGCFYIEDGHIHVLCIHSEDRGDDSFIMEKFKLIGM